MVLPGDGHYGGLMRNLRARRSTRIPLATGATLLALAVPAPGALALAPVLGGEYFNRHTTEWIEMCEAGTSGNFLVIPKRCNEGLSISGLKPAKISPAGVLSYNGYGNGTLSRPKLVISGLFTDRSTLKWKVTITMRGCKETLSSTLKFTRIPTVVVRKASMLRGG